ncbi:aldehyde dehydrogenase [Cutaneotrichosporon oleaginosum]|uniref:Aldehyde dehydrogenase n=1 Tax=Cutaneotrichosporon oleaginosum TaxID=879819 RepID=A0A0J0XH54_9TREE|nr:aldehyde dehydrogenase [Cutaneotrichosporon oleaginosum]KLT40383.1 aldehyde dehydrogenase [Cutaneotrichosporon oleaginosum]TXT11349.1 hypothetical protein COLE_01759 [Cutaneotrichosporon oleaginosum]
MTAIVTNLIGSTTQAPAATFDVVHPGTGQRVHAVQRSTASDLFAAVDATAAALPGWRDTPLRERQAVFSRAAALLKDADSGWAQRLISANVSETSCGDWWATEQVGAVPHFLEALVNAAPDALKEDSVDFHGSTYKISREPYGVCLAIAAWNAVALLTARAVVTPLLAGNTVVLKSSEQVPRSQALWGELLRAAGLPAGALNVVHVATEDAGALTPALVADPRVRHVNFTGSTRVGAIIASLAGQHLKPTLMELGGKAPVLILPDADIDVAANHIIFGAFMNAGQVCMSSERVLVPESKYDALVAALQKAWEGVRGPPRALFTRASAARVRSLVQDATEKGAADILASARAEGEGAHVHPLILGPVDPGMRLHAEESFGPVCVLVRIPDASEDAMIDEMVRIANASEYGLSASVWGRDLVRAEAVARRIEAGAVHINSPTPADAPLVPHGGWKSSGWGRFNGAEGLRGFTQTRSIEVPGKAAEAMPLQVFGL